MSRIIFEWNRVESLFALARNEEHLEPDFRVRAHAPLLFRSELQFFRFASDLLFCGLIELIERNHAIFATTAHIFHGMGGDVSLFLLSLCANIRVL